MVVATAHDQPAELLVLDLLAAPIWVWEFRRGGIVWGNRAALALWGEIDLDGLRRHGGARSLATNAQTRLWQADIDGRGTTGGVWPLAGAAGLSEVAFRAVRYSLPEPAPAMLVEVTSAAVDAQAVPPAAADEPASPPAERTEPVVRPVPPPAEPAVRPVPPLGREEVRLREGRDQMRLLVNSVPACLAYVGADERVRFANPALLDWFGCAPEPLIGCHVAEVLGECHAALEPALRRALGGEAGSLQVERSDPRRRIGQAALVPDRAVDGTVRGVCLLVTDITELTATSRALAASERRIRGILDSAADWFWELDADLRVSFVSDSFARALFRAPREAVGERLWSLPELIPPQEPLVNLRTDLEARRTVRGAVIEVVDGSQRRRFVRLAATPSWDRSGRFLGYSGSAADVGPLVEAEQRARAAEARYRQLAEQAAAGIFVAGPSLAVSAANRRFAELLGVGQAELRSGAWARRVHAGDIPKLLAIFDPRRPAERGRQLLFRFDHPDGRTRWLHCEAEPQGGDAAPLEMVGTLSDVTDWKRQEVDLKVAKQSAEESSASKTSFLAATSHELRTPLNAIIGFAELMERQLLGPIGNPRYVEYIANIREAGLSVLSLVNDLLDIARIEAGRLEVRPEQTDIVAVILQVLRQTEPVAGRQQIRLEARVAPELRPVRMDPRHLSQMLANLVTNAIKYSEPGRRVVVAAKTDAAGRLVLRVADEGIGMSPEQRLRALEPFTQVATDLVRYGLGLYLVAAIAAANGGQLTLHSRPGRGTIARLTFAPPAKRDRVY